MSDRVVPLVATGPRDPLTLRRPAGPPRPVDDVLADLARAAAEGVRLVLLEDAEAAHPALGAIVAGARRLDLAPALVGLPAASGPACKALGVEILVLPLHGDAATHDAVTAPGAHAATLALLAATSRPRVRLVTALSARTVATLAEAVRAGGAAERLTLTGEVPDPVVGDALLAALDAAWTAAVDGPDLALVGAHAPPEASRGPVRRLDENLLALRRAGGWLPGLSSGVRAPGATPTGRAALHALGFAAERGDGDGDGPLPYPPADGEVVVVVPHVADALLATSTLPALVDALRARGVPARLESVWERPWNLRAPAAPSGLDVTAAEGERQRLARRLSDRLLDTVDLRGAGRVIVPGWAAAARLRRNPTRPPGVALEIVDLHLLDGLEAWPELGAPGAPWPDPDAFVTSCFPAFLPALEARGVGVDRLRFRPYPIAAAHLPTSAPADDPAAPVLVAGNQRRDHRLLVDALGRHPPPRPVHVVSRDPVDVPGAVHRGHLPLRGLVDAVASARVVVLPVESRPHDAAGITVAALALALGRPVVGTTAWGLVDHVRHGTSGLLVPPGDADALGRAVDLVARDDGLHARLAAGARAAGAALSVEAWADALAGRPAAPWPVRGPVDDDPLGSWPVCDPAGRGVPRASPPEA